MKLVDTSILRVNALIANMTSSSRISRSVVRSAKNFMDENGNRLKDFLLVRDLLADKPSKSKLAEHFLNQDQDRLNSEDYAAAVPFVMNAENLRKFVNSWMSKSSEIKDLTKAMKIYDDFITVKIVTLINS